MPSAFYGITPPKELHGTPHVFRYGESTGTFTDLCATVQDGYLVFTTTHFSYYIIAGTGKSAGAVWIMFDVYDNKNRLLTHASVLVDVKMGIRPRGDSTRQIGVY